MKIIYRLSEKGKPIDFFGIDKLDCLRNFVNEFKDEHMIVLTDNCTVGFVEKVDEILKTATSWDRISTQLGNSKSLQKAFEMAIDGRWDDLETVYFVEDDFLHLPKSCEILKEGIQKADYVTLYDHSDKYLNNGPNPYVTGGENTFVFKTNLSHWKYTNSTVQTFTTTVKTLREDKDILWKYNFNGPTPDSFNTFIELIKTKNRRIASALPGKSTHCMTQWASPCIDWEVESAEITKRPYLPMWMEPEEKELLLSNIKPTDDVFEWGSGGSTFEIARRCKTIKSIEHDEVWYYKIRDKICEQTVKNLTYCLYPNDKPRSFPHVNRDEFETYIGAIHEAKMSFDVVFIDGRARNWCAEEALKHLNPGAKLFVHDWDRPKYHEILKDYNLIKVAGRMAMLESK